MNEWISRIFELPARQRAIILVAVVGLLFFGYAYVWYWPRATEIADKEAKIEDLTRERNLKATLAVNLPNMRKMVADLDAALKQAIAQLPDKKEIPELLSSVSSVGRESGLEVIQFRQRPEVLSDFYAEVPVEILVRGTFHQTAAFFDQVGRLTRIVNVSDISIKTPAKVERDSVILDTSGTATTFRFLDEAERERVAKEREKKAKQ